jgi:hypothetical protein
MSVEAGNRWPLWVHALPLLAGLAVLVVTFLWLDPLWPGQDMPSDIARRYRAAAARAAEIYTIGRWLSLAGLVWLAAVLAWRRRRRAGP